MFKKSTVQQTAELRKEGISVEACPKCGHPDVVGDICPRCRVKVSAYRSYLAGLTQKAPVPPAGASKSSWLGRLRDRGTFKKLFMVVPNPSSAASVERRSTYEQVIQARIYRELRYPETTRGLYVVLLAFNVNAVGRLERTRFAVYPPNPDVSSSLRLAISHAEPFPLPPTGSEDQRFSLALTVSI